MSNADFELLLNLIGSKISKENINFRGSIPISQRLVITLWFLSSGDLYVLCTFINIFYNNSL